MPDPIVILEALLAAAVVAAAAVLLGGWPWRTPNARRLVNGWVVGIGAGWLLGAIVLGIRPHWPPREDADRLLFLVIPAVVAMELLAGLQILPRRASWALRGLGAVLTGRVLLDNTSYLTDLAGPGTREWSVGTACLILGGLAVLLAVVWAALALLAERTPGRSLPVTLAGTAAGAGLAVMLSGYATGGQLGLPLSGAVLGATLASLFLKGPADVRGSVGVGIVGIYAVLILGRYFGQLTTAHLILILLAPLAGWLPELVPTRRLQPWLRGLLRVIIVAVPVVLIVLQAQRQFVASSASKSGPAGAEPSLQDYMDFGK